MGVVKVEELLSKEDLLIMMKQQSDYVSKLESEVEILKQYIQIIYNSAKKEGAISEDTKVPTTEELYEYRDGAKQELH
ncbi:hypothetical protein [Vibrio splendidus]|uniref:hypothetical protein n=1 Tax=Vibrio splendidus TaxID=29497 RepID=UPI000D33ABC1|nr:hypothetical protein [Vibrio splendidus]PTP95468.1 hypothetical protein CWO02_01095 [Vibrio splendidus]